MEPHVANNSEQGVGDTPKAAESLRTVPNHAENFGKVPNDSETFGTIPKASESFRRVPNPSENFGGLPHVSERKEYCTLSVREAARMFEAAGVARTERSIINWCQVNKQGVARLENYFDPNERKYFISPQSVELAIQEEKAKAAKGIESKEPSETIPNVSERARKEAHSALDTDAERVKELEKEIIDLKITNRGKDFFIEQLQKEREGFVREIITSNRKVGELETKLLQLENPHNRGR